MVAFAGVDAGVSGEMARGGEGARAYLADVFLLGEGGLGGIGIGGRVVGVVGGVGRMEVVV